MVLEWPTLRWSSTNLHMLHCVSVVTSVVTSVVVVATSTSKAINSSNDACLMNKQSDDK